ncbi:hypothetical protein LCGC14_0899290 [marine sediment metagenome]|uniref:Uncharacterized protein n=1 Tax=marine sediment metagenome TaxID=412755 RepID=A0A0F9RFZ8_9ZZZZ
MANREVTLKTKLRAAQDLEADPNEGSRLQQQIDLLTKELVYLLKKVREAGI